MNLWYLLLLVCCCGHGGRMCAAGHSGCVMPRRGGCADTGKDRREERCRKTRGDRDDCGCREKRQEEDRCSCMMPCMDSVPEMNMPSHYPVYPEKCACRE